MNYYKKLLLLFLIFNIDYLFSSPQQSVEQKESFFSLIKKNKASSLFFSIGIIGLLYPVLKNNMSDHGIVIFNNLKTTYIFSGALTALSLFSNQSKARENKVNNETTGLSHWSLVKRSILPCISFPIAAIIIHNTPDDFYNFIPSMIATQSFLLWFVNYFLCKEKQVSSGQPKDLKKSKGLEEKKKKQEEQEEKGSKSVDLLQESAEEQKGERFDRLASYKCSLDKFHTLLLQKKLLSDDTCINQYNRLVEELRKLEGKAKSESDIKKFSEMCDQFTSMQRHAIILVNEEAEKQEKIKEQEIIQGKSIYTSRNGIKKESQNNESQDLKEELKLEELLLQEEKVEEQEEVEVEAKKVVEKTESFTEEEEKIIDGLCQHRAINEGNIYNKVLSLIQTRLSAGYQVSTILDDSDIGDISDINALFPKLNNLLSNNGYKPIIDKETIMKIIMNIQDNESDIFENV